MIYPQKKPSPTLIDILTPSTPKTTLRGNMPLMYIHLCNLCIIRFVALSIFLLFATLYKKTMI